MKYTEKRIQYLIAQFHRHSGTYLLPNVKVIANAESDLIRVTTSRYLHEYEIKVSIADLKREYKKDRWHKFYTPDRFTLAIRCFNIVVPVGLVEDARELVREGHGLIGACLDTMRLHHVITPKINKDAKPMTDLNMIYLLSKMEHRYWNKFEYDMYHEIYNQKTSINQLE